MKRRGAALAASALAGGGAWLVHHPDAEPARRSRERDVRGRVVQDSVSFSDGVQSQPWPGTTRSVCEALADQVISLPMHAYLSDAQAHFVCDAFEKALKG